LLVIDDFAISPMGAPERNDLLELLDDRVGTRSTLITSQLPVKAWHTYLDDPTLAMPFWTELCTAAIALISRGRRCARTSESRQSIRPLWLLLCNAQGAQRWQRNSR
jgi:DNA replication protein DnaC